MKYLAAVLAVIAIASLTHSEEIGTAAAKIVSAFNAEMAKHERRSPV